MSSSLIRLAIIGAGPAGLAAAAEATRLGCDSILLVDETGRAGGTIRQAHAVRSVPFLPDHAPGELVADELEAFRRRIGVEVVAARIETLQEHDDRIRLESHDGRVWFARAAVIATGTQPRCPQVPGLPLDLSPPWAGSAGQAAARGTLRVVAVIGGGDVAFDQSCWLRARGVEVWLLCRSLEPRAPRWLQTTAADAGVKVLLGCRVVEGRTASGRVVLRTEQGSQAQELDVDCVLAAIGRVPRLLGGTLARESARWKVVGDATGRRERHVVAAMGDGCLAVSKLLAGQLDRSER